MNPPELPPMTWRNLLARLPEGTDSAAIQAKLHALAADHGTPWLLNVFAGVGAWFSAFFMMGWLGLAGAHENKAASFIFGALTMGAGIALSRSTRNVFVSQLSLAALLSGNGLILGGAVREIHDFVPMLQVMTLTQALVAAVACAAYRGVVGNFICVFAVQALAVVWVVFGKQPQFLHAIVGILAVLSAGLFIWQRRPRVLDPVAYACIVALPCLILFTELVHCIDFAFMRQFYTVLWPSSLILAVVLLATLAMHAGGPTALARPWMILAAAAIALLAAFTTPGLLVAMFLLFIGYAYSDRPLTILGYLFLTGFLVLFYYALNISLAQKSWIIAGSGVLMLVVRQLATFCVKKDQEMETEAAAP